MAHFSGNVQVCVRLAKGREKERCARARTECDARNVSSRFPLHVVLEGWVM